jgi:hypothetical protein
MEGSSAAQFRQPPEQDGVAGDSFHRIRLPALDIIH